MKFYKEKLTLILASVYIALEHPTGIGPAYSAWEADVLPLN